MNLKLHLLLACALAGSAAADFRIWTRTDGKTAELNLTSVREVDGEKVGEFKMRTGRVVTLKQSMLTEGDAKLLGEWQSPEAAAAATSVFDSVLKGNLVMLEGKSFKPCKDFVNPQKYFLFYYTASWCGPCHRFTPSLVAFYNKYKPANREFEVVLITCDDSEDAMEQYAKELKMPWPQLKISKVPSFRKQFKHPGSGIPNLVLTDMQGNLLKTSYDGGNYVGPGVPMAHLESLLKK